eukprot:COSAG01_NODE_27569_length_682_cov_1.072041_1_plen_46_part_01
MLHAYIMPCKVHRVHLLLLAAARSGAAGPAAVPPGRTTAIALSCDH